MSFFEFNRKKTEKKQVIPQSQSDKRWNYAFFVRFFED
jgi:hypothetical protein